MQPQQATLKTFDGLLTDWQETTIWIVECWNLASWKCVVENERGTVVQAVLKYYWDLRLGEVWRLRLVKTRLFDQRVDYSLLEDSWETAFSKRQICQCTDQLWKTKNTFLFPINIMLNLSLWTHLMNVIPEVEIFVIPRRSRRRTDRLPNFVVYTSSEARLATSRDIVIAKEKVLDSRNVCQSWNDRELKTNKYNFFTYSRFCNMYCMQADFGIQSGIMWYWGSYTGRNQAAGQ